MESFRHLEIVAPKDALPAPVPNLRMRPNKTSERGPSGLGDYWEAIWRRKGTVASATVLSAAAASPLTLPQTPVFRGQTSLESQGPDENFLRQKQGTPNAS